MEFYVKGISLSPVRTESVESCFIDLRVVAKISSHEVPKFKLPTKTLQNMQNFKLFLFFMQLQHNIIKLNTGSIPFSNRKYKGRKKVATKEKK